MSPTARRLLVFAFVALGLTLVVARFGVRTAWTALPQLNRPTARRAKPGGAYDDNEAAARTLAVHAAIARANNSLLDALRRSDAAAYAEHFADDALSMPGYGPIVRGRSAIAAAMEDTFGKLRFAEVNVSTLDTRQVADTVLETGRYRYVVAPHEGGSRQTLSGRYVIVWKRAGHRWKIALDAAQPGAAPS